MTLMMGCRSPESLGEGYSDRVFVYVDINGIKQSVLFENGNMTIFDTKYSMEHYNHFVSRGWKPMTIYDLTLTTGIDNGISYSQVNIFQKMSHVIKATFAIGLYWFVARRMIHEKI
jgi:hypothetical protein